MAAKLNFKQTDMPFTVMSYEADMDYILARMIHFTGTGFYRRAGFLAQMACEKYLKALTIQNEKCFANNSHALPALGQYCEKYDPYFAEPETKRVLQQFDAFTEVGRYGGAAKFDPLAKGASVGGWSVQFGSGVIAAGVSIWTPQCLQDLDAFVFKIRSMLDFKTLGQKDGLRAVLNNDVSYILVSEWQFPIPIHDVLTHFNSWYTSSVLSRPISR